MTPVLVTTFISQIDVPIVSDYCENYANCPYIKHMKQALGLVFTAQGPMALLGPPAAAVLTSHTNTLVPGFTMAAVCVASSVVFILSIRSN